MASTLADFRYGFRSLSRDPGSALIAVLTLALGIGLCTITFCLLYGVFLRGLDIPEPDRVRVIQRSNPSRNIDFMTVTQHDFYDWRERQKSFEALASYTSGQTVNLSDSLGPERYEGVYVSANLFDVLRVRPIVGAAFREGDDRPGVPLTVILSHAVWKNRYGADPAVIGRTVRLNGEHATVLGVMAPGFMFPQDALLWIPQRDVRARSPNRQGGPSHKVMGRLREGVTWEQARAEMATIAAGLARDYPTTNEGVTTAFQTVVEDDNGPEIIAVFTGMQVATILVLLVACANVANLLLARATLRTREAAVRTAIGASRLRVVLPFFAETVLLAAAGALLGTGIAAVGIELFDRATQDVGKPYYMVFTLDAPILAFVVGIAALTALAAGAAPALQIMRTNLSATLKDESRGASGVAGGRISRALVVTQMALSCALLVGAGLMVKSIARLDNYRYPFATENILTARIGLFDTSYPDTLSRQRFWRTLEDRLRGLPGVAAVSLTTDLPGDGGGGRVAIEGASYTRDEDYPEVGFDVITPDFFKTFDVGMREGRAFTARDDAAATPATIVNQEFADRYFAGADPIGRRIRPGTSTSTAPWFTIVGIAPTLAVRGLNPGNQTVAQYYLPLAQRDPSFMFIALRTVAGDGMALAPSVRHLVRSLNPDLPIFDVYSMLRAMHNRTWFFRVFGTLFIVFGVAALFMASVGLYGVLAFSVTRRVREMGIRMALGASAGDVVRLVLRQGANQTMIGLAAGLLLAFGLSRVLGFLMFDVNPADPLVFGTIAFVIVTVGLAASWIPAKRATAVDPLVALRTD